MPTRRAVLASFAAVACARTTGRGSGDTGDTAAAAPLPVGDDTPLEPITPTEALYHVSMSPYIPDEAALAAWTITFSDDDGNEVVVTPDALRALGAESQERTIACIGGGSSATIGNVVWGQRRLDEIFAAFDFRPDARLGWLRIHAGDGYVTDLPRSDLDSGLALAWELNGAPLPPDHGAPARLLVPGRYGMKNPKWVTRIEVVETYAAGFWESRGWSQDAEYLTQAWFVTPTYGASVTTEGIWAKGVAFAGERGISRVEVSLDDGTTWQDAEITYAGGPGVWTVWRCFVAPEGPGLLPLRVRATDGTGVVQPHQEDFDADLDGLEGWDLATVDVVEA